MWQIATRELGAFFNTWMGYVIVAAALIIDGLLFNAFAVSNEPKFSADVLADFFYFASGMSMVAGIFLAMRLMAEEKQSGTIVLLYSSPVSERQVIYGKFLSALLFSLVLHVMSLYMPALVMVHGKVSPGHIASGYLCLTTSQRLNGRYYFIRVYARAKSACGCRRRVIYHGYFADPGMVAKVVDQPFKDIFGWLSIHSDHFTPFSNGIVNSQDVVFYAGVIVFFLECASRATALRHRSQNHYQNHPRGSAEGLRLGD